ncbi:MAG: acyl-CoA/acyl-ACP dehydrogenase [Planctomycetales bacterium]|nr:acyl-CoA/acyl-ACP dehydrogenase [Planctomycetales bacterium]
MQDETYTSSLDAYSRRQLGELCDRLAEASGSVERDGKWPQLQMDWYRDAGVFKWFVPEEYGGYGWSELQQLEGYLELSQSCLTTTFILTQWVAACRRIAGGSNNRLKERLLPDLAAGRRFATVGISHLTTSRQHVAKPVLMAEEQDDGFRLQGFTPWVTSASSADTLVIGATHSDGRQIMCAVPAEREGLRPAPGQPLVALTASCTDSIEFDNVLVEFDEIIDGPVENVMSINSGGGAGGLQTSTLAIGLSLAAVKFLVKQAELRSDLAAVATKLQQDVAQLRQGLFSLTAGENTSWTNNDLRQQANSLVLRSTQAALSAAKGAGFLASHPTGRWAREALFFLVWSCPQPIVAANLCELAQLSH